MASLPAWDARVMKGASNLLSAWDCETFYQILGLFTGKIGEFVLVYRIFLAAALVFWLIAPVTSDFRSSVHPRFSGVRTHPSRPLPFSGALQFPTPAHRLAKA